MEIRIRKRLIRQSGLWAMGTDAGESWYEGVILTANIMTDSVCGRLKVQTIVWKNSPWKKRTGNVVKELSEACKNMVLSLPFIFRHGIAIRLIMVHLVFALLLCTVTWPADKLWTGIWSMVWRSEWWWRMVWRCQDIRTIDRKNYYNYPRIYEMLDSIQPQAIIFSDGGPGCRWVGNEKVLPGLPTGHSCERERCIRDMIRAMNCSMDIRMEISGCLQSVMCLSVRDGSIIRRKMTE